MGSIDVFDSKLQKWVPYKEDVEYWIDYFKPKDHIPDQIRNLEKILEEKNKLLRDMEEKLEKVKTPQVKMVSPLAKVVDRAKSQIKRKNGVDDDCKNIKRKKTHKTYRKDPDWAF